MTDVIDKYEQTFRDAGEEWNVDPTLLKALAKHESGGDPAIRGKSGEIGLGQFMPDTARRIGITDRSNPVQSIWGMAKLMNEALVAEKDNPTAALRYYNGGAGWRNSRTDPNYPSYVGGQYKKYAKANTGSMTDATPAPASAEPAKLSDADWLDEQAKTYPHLAGLNAATPAKPASATGDPAVPSTSSADAPSADDLLARMGRLSGGPGAAPAAPAKAGSATPAEPAAPSGDDLLRRMGTIAPTAPMAPPEPPPPPGVEPGSAVDTLNRAVTSLGASPRAASAQPLANVLASPEALAGDIPQSQEPGPPLTTANVNALLAPAPNTTYAESPILPLARDNTTGQIRLAMPSSIRSLLQGGADLLQGPGGMVMSPNGTPMLSPDATGALATVAGIRSPAAGTGKLIAGAEDAALRARVAALPPPEPHPLSPEAQAPVVPPTSPEAAASAFVPPGSAVPPLPRILELLEADKKMAATRPTEIPPNTPQPPNPLSEPAPRVTPSAPPREVGPDVGGPAPQGAGAAASREGTPPGMLSERTDGQKIAAMEKSVTQTAEERAGPQMQDHHAYVEGIPPRTLAARDFSQSVNALDEKVARAKDPEFRDAVDSINRKRNEGMVDLLRKDAQDGIALEKAHEARSEFSPDELGVFNGEKSVDFTPLVEKIRGILKGPDGKEGAVRRTLTSVLDSLHNDAGAIETLPSQGYGARKNLTTLLKKGVKGTTDLADDVRASKHILTNLIPDFDKIISDGAPKFASEYLPKWHEMSQPINQMEFLQRYQTGAKKLTNDQGYLQPHKVQTMLDDILQANKGSGVHGAKALTDTQFQNIEAVRNELAAQGLQDRLASVRGADSFQQFNRPNVFSRGPVGGTVKALGELAMGIPTLGVANFAYHYGLKPGLEVRRQSRIAGLEAARKRELLAPPNLLDERR